MSSVQTSFPFQNGQSSALTVVVGFAIVSLIAVDFVWMRVVWVALNMLFKRGSMAKVNRERAIFHSQLGAYVASLLISNLLSSVSFVLNVPWVQQNRIFVGGLCSTQGGMSQIADVATAYFTAAIAVHTFNTLVLRNRLPSWFCVVATAFGWLAAGLMGILPPKFPLREGPFYGPDGATCGISEYYPTLQTVLHLVPIFISALVSSLFYSLVFLILRGTLAIRGGLKLNLDLEARRSTMYDSFEYPKFIAAIARSMLWYPVVYVALMGPHLIICLLEAHGTEVPFIWKIVSMACSALLGLANVLVFYNTIRIMGPAFNRPGQTASEKSESFVSPHKNESPLDVTPPAAPFAAPRSFPPPRSANSTPRPSLDASPRPSMNHSRQKSSGGESTRHLLNGHAHSNSSVSVATMASLDRAITPVSQLNEMISMPPPAMRKPSMRTNVNDRADNGSDSLPAPRRKERSPVMRRPTLSTIPSPMDTSLLSAVPLQTAAPSDSQEASKRNSFINMYASRTPVPSSSDDSQFARPAMMINDVAMPMFTSPRSGSTVGYSTDSDSDVPRSAFADRSIRPKRSFRSEVQARLSMTDADVPERGLSSLAWATLVADAATSNGGVAAAAKLRTERRRSKSMESLRVPSSLQPRAPSSASWRSDRSEVIPTPRTGTVSRWDSKANYRESPSRTPAYRTPTEGVNRSSTYR